MYVTLGTDTESGSAVTIGDRERRSGLYLLGKPGMGKSILLTNLIYQDIQHGHGVFFLDLFGDATNGILERLQPVNRSEILLLEPQFDTQSFGIKIFCCPNISDFTTLYNTYMRAFKVFYQFWEQEWSPFLALIIANLLHVFIGRQEYSLAEIPLFLTDTKFRDHMLQTTNHNKEAVEFWQRIFASNSKHDQKTQFNIPLTKVSMLLGHPYVKHIFSQHQSMINFSHLIKNHRILLVKLSASPEPNIKNFICRILISELTNAIRNMPPDKCSQYCVFLDGFQNFVTAEDFEILTNQAQGSNVATTVIQTDRHNELRGKKELMRATAVISNKIVFQLTVRDAQELAPEFVQNINKQQTFADAVDNIAQELTRLPIFIVNAKLIQQNSIRRFANIKIEPSSTAFSEIFNNAF